MYIHMTKSPVLIPPLPEVYGCGPEYMYVLYFFGGIG